MDIQKQDIFTQRLAEFGLNTAESKIYLYLLQLGKKTGGSNIAQATGLHRQYVYNALPKLIAHGLVKEVPKGKQHKYIAQPPIEIEKIGRKKALSASDLARDLNTISNIGNEQDFEVIQGKESIQQYEMSYVANNKEPHEEYIIGGASLDFRTLMGDVFEEYLAFKQEKEIIVKYIGGSTEMKEYSKHFGIYPNQEYRFLKKLPEGTANMVIRNDTVCFFSYLIPPLVYVVKSSTVAEHYKKFFEMLWEMSESIEQEQ